MNEKTNYFKKFVFLFQLAQEGIGRDVYKKLIAPYENDMPNSTLDGFRRVCADRKFAFIDLNILDKELATELSCHVMPLPDAFYSHRYAFIIIKNSPYKGLINWRWDNGIKSTRYTTNSSLKLWVHWKLPSTKRHVHQLFRNKSFNLSKVLQVCTNSQMSYVLLFIIWNLKLKNLCNWESVN